MIDRETVFLLGAQDPEMREIERVLSAAGMRCLHAARNGVRCAAGNAYAAIDSPEINYFPGNRRMVAEPLARHRGQFGLPPGRDAAAYAVSAVTARSVVIRRLTTC